MRFVDKAAQVWATPGRTSARPRILEETRSGSAGTNGAIRTTPSRSCWPKRRTRFGRGITNGPVKWTYYYLYVILDIFSRYVVGWMLAHRESAALGAESCRKQDIEPDQLTLHADRGSSMRSKPVGLLLADLGVTKTHSRPYVERQSLLRVSVQDDEVLSSVSEPLWFRRRPAILLRFLRLLQFPPPALGNRPYDTGRRSLWSSRTAHHRSAPDPSRSSTGSSRTLRSRTPQPPVLPPQGINPPLEKTTLHDAAQAPLAAASIPGVLLHATRSWSMLTSIAPTSRVSPP